MRIRIEPLSVNRSEAGFAERWRHPLFARSCAMSAATLSTISALNGARLLQERLRVRPRH
jgi:hypothetical protein